MQVYELASKAAQFDLVLFMGVFYHLRYPRLGLEIAAQRCWRGSAGLEVTERLGHEIYLTRPAPAGAPSEAPYDFTPELPAATGQPWR